MLSFKSFLSEIRQGLPHVYSTTTEKGNETPSLSVDQFKSTTKGGKVHIHSVTEKTDGQTFKIGHDEHGFYTQHSGSGSDRIRTGQGHIDRAKRRAEETGKPYSPTAHVAFAKFHDALHQNEKLQAHLKSEHAKRGHIELRGEAFNRHIATPGDHPNEVKFVHTSYHTKHLGKTGAFVIHSKLPENQHHNLEAIKAASDDHIKFHDDQVKVKPGHVDVKPETDEFAKLNHGLIGSRTTKTNKQAKMEELGKFNQIKKKVHDKIQDHLRSQGIQNKFGSGSEGLIVHPSEANKEAARFKVLSPSFKGAKASSKLFKR